ncbi:MAG: DUF885 domain-containing protein [Chloroflexi bacterium]|nr:DUF885 domain-containing protein [Chloroflexota bacterium]
MNKPNPFHQFLADDWETRMQADPLFATYTGDNRFNDRLPDISEAYYENYLSALRGLETRLGQFERASLPPADQLNFDIYSRLLANEIGLLGFNAYRMPISKAGGFHTYFPELYLQMPMASEQDYENYISRLAAFKQYAEGHIEVMRTGIREGQIPPRVTIEGVADSIRPQIVDDPARSLFYKPFEQVPGLVSGLAAGRLKEAGLAAIRESVLPGYTALLRFVLDEYMPAARTSISAADLPDGRDYYRLCIRHFTSLDLTPEEVHQTGLDEVQRIQAEMQAVIHQVGFEGDFKAFVEFLRTDPRFYAATPEALLEKTALVLKRMDGELPGLFKTLPRLSYGIRPIPDYAAPGSTTAYYQPGAGDGSRAGYYYVNTYDLKSRPFYEIEALSLHEAVPGHHLQIALQQELDLPNFRRFNGFTSFVEGWALYSERLGLETGFYTDPYSNFGRLSYEMWRACRLVVDTGIHALGWTRKQAIDFMAGHTSLTLLNITNEVDRYIAWPGQALAYKIGEIKIRQLRTQAEKELGAQFNLREFHDVLLTSGAVPLDVLEATVKTWVESRK